MKLNKETATWEIPQASALGNIATSLNYLYENVGSEEYWDILSKVSAFETLLSNRMIAHKTKRGRHEQA